MLNLFVAIIMSGIFITVPLSVYLTKRIRAGFKPHTAAWFPMCSYHEAISACMKL